MWFVLSCSSSSCATVVSVQWLVTRALCLDRALLIHRMSERRSEDNSQRIAVEISESVAPASRLTRFHSPHTRPWPPLTNETVRFVSSSPTLVTLADPALRKTPPISSPQPSLPSPPLIRPRTPVPRVPGAPSRPVPAPNVTRRQHLPLLLPQAVLQPWNREKGGT